MRRVTWMVWLGLTALPVGLAFAAGLAPSLGGAGPHRTKVIPLYSGAVGKSDLVRLGADRGRGQNTTTISGTGLRPLPHIGGTDMSRRR
jgi:hypothetical protein